MVLPARRPHLNAHGTGSRPTSRPPHLKSVGENRSRPRTSETSVREMDAYVLSWLGKRTPPCFQRVVSLFSPCFSLLFAFGEICLSALFLTVIARSHSIAFPVFLGKSPCFRGKTGGDGV